MMKLVIKKPWCFKVIMKITMKINKSMNENRMLHRSTCLEKEGKSKKKKRREEKRKRKFK